MGLFNHLFGGRIGRSEEVITDAKKRSSLLQDYLQGYARREELVRAINFKNIDATLADPERLMRLLDDVEGTVDRDLMDIEGEETVESEIIDDLAWLVHKERGEQETLDLHDALRNAEKQEGPIRDVFKKLHRVIRVLLHALRIAKQKPSKPLLFDIFKLVNFQEARLNEPFRRDQYHDPADWERVMGIARAIILEEEVHEEARKIEDGFERLMASAMGPEREGRILGPFHPHKGYRSLAERMIIRLIEKVGGPWADQEGFDQGFPHFEEFIGNERTMMTVIEDLLHEHDVELSAEEIRVIARAFRKAYNKGHFDDMGHHLYK